MKYEHGALSVAVDGKILSTDEQTQFKFGAWLVKKSASGFVLTHIYDDMELTLATVDEHIDIEISGSSGAWVDGLLSEFTGLEVTLLEKQQKQKVLKTTTLMINGSYLRYFLGNIRLFSTIFFTKFFNQIFVTLFLSRRLCTCRGICLKFRQPKTMLGNFTGRYGKTFILGSFF